MAKALLLDPLDDVAIMLEHVVKGQPVALSGGDEAVLAAASDLPIHHKIALRDLPENTPLRRGGLVIGKTKQAISKGGHVHIHNLTSLRASPSVVLL
ncbi:MAG: UxaA family hydrolase [Pseudomonadota bacterium]